MANVTKAQIKEKLAKVMKSKEECITVFGLKTKFGGGRSTGFALIYDNLDAKKMYASKTQLLRVSFQATRRRANHTVRLFTKGVSVYSMCSNK